MSKEKVQLKTPRAEIKKTRSKKQPFRSIIIGENGEPIGGSHETLTTRLNAQKNIIAHIKAVKGTGIWVIDYTNGEEYHMMDDGSKTPF